MRRRDFIAGFGSATAWPLVAPAQQAAIPVVGFLSGRGSEESAQPKAAFLRALAENGYVVGRNVALEYRWAEGRHDRLPSMAAELVARDVSVLVAVGGDHSVLAAKAATSVIPIVFNIGSDPLKLELVASENRPGANVTGVTMITATLEPKRLGLLHELLPQATRIAALLNPENPPSERQLNDIREAARALRLELHILRASTGPEIEKAFQSVAQLDVPALAVASDPFFLLRRDRIVALAAHHKVPAMYQFREYTVAGGLMSYGTSLAQSYRQVAVYTSQVLKGAKPSDLPVVRASKFEFVINLKTAKALGIGFSDNLLSLADEVIE